MRANRLRAHGIGTAMAVLIALAACGTSESPVAPAPVVTPPPPPPPFQPDFSPGPVSTVTGTVIDVSAAGVRRPVPNLRLKVRAGSPNDGAVGGLDLPDVVTDVNGRYQIAGLTSYLLFVTTAPGSAHRFLCEFYPLDLQAVKRSPFLTDLPVVPVTWSGDRLPPGMSWIVGTTIYGVVSERVSGALRPVAEATVTFESGLQDPPATTNATGFYMICSVVGTDQDRTITARKDGYRQTSRTVLIGYESRFDLELARE